MVTSKVHADFTILERNQLQRNEKRRNNWAWTKSNDWFICGQHMRPSIWFLSEMEERFSMSIVRMQMKIGRINCFMLNECSDLCMFGNHLELNCVFIFASNYRTPPQRLQVTLTAVFIFRSFNSFGWMLGCSLKRNIHHNIRPHRKYLDLSSVLQIAIFCC